MSRFIERAENVARIIDVNAQLMLDLPRQQTEALAANWHPVVACLGEEEAFAKRHERADVGSVTDFLVFDRSHPNSITGSLAWARENARTVREQITTEMWEQINRTFLWLMSKTARQFYERSNYDFFQRVKKSLQLFQGITDSVMVHGEGWEFLQIGKYLERADKTSRLLDDAFFLLPSDPSRPIDAIPQWISILRTCNARQAYQRLYASVVEPIKVADLLLLNENFPRSVAFCVDQVDQSLRRLSGVPPGRFSNLAEKLSGRLLSELSYSSIDEFWARGLHATADQLQLKLNEIGAAVAESVIHPSLPPNPGPGAAGSASVPQ